MHVTIEVGSLVTEVCVNFVTQVKSTANYCNEHEIMRVMLGMSHCYCIVLVHSVSEK